jgi:multiple sugar transport system permease protein
MSRNFLWKRRIHLTMLSIVMLLIFLFPIYWMLTTAIKSEAQIMTYPPQIVPTGVDWTVWQRRIFNDPIIPRFFLNSAIIGVGTMLLTVSLAAPAAYGLTHLRIRGKSLLLLVSLASLMFPAVMLATPLFVIFSRLQILDTLLALILANTALNLPFALIVIRPFFNAVPVALTEAAVIDGCNSWQVFRRIILPLVKPGLITAAIFTFLFGWSELVFGLALINTEELRPVTAGLWYFMGANVTQWNAVMALSTLIMIPPLVLYLLGQRYIVSGITAGAVNK